MCVCYFSIAEYKFILVEYSMFWQFCKSTEEHIGDEIFVFREDIALYNSNLVMQRLPDVFYVFILTDCDPVW